ncbi:T9SS type A sorting domain-containing protein [bacterium]|nr:T9SS type A sorting domain-containing protein [bacterium]
MKRLIVFVLACFSMVLSGNEIQFSFSEVDTLFVPYSYKEIVYDKFENDFVRFYNWELDGQTLTISKFTLDSDYNFSSQESIIDIELNSVVESIDDIFVYYRFLNNREAFHISDKNLEEWHSDETTTIDYILLLNDLGDSEQLINIKDINENYVFRQLLSDDKILLGSSIDETNEVYENFILNIDTYELQYWMNTMYYNDVLFVENMYIQTSDLYIFQNDDPFEYRVFNSNFEQVNEVYHEDVPNNLINLFTFIDRSSFFSIDGEDIFNIPPYLLKRANGRAVADLSISSNELIITNLKEYDTGNLVKVSDSSYITFLARYEGWFLTNNIKSGNEYEFNEIQLLYIPDGIFTSKDYIVINNDYDTTLRVYNDQLDLLYSENIGDNFSSSSRTFNCFDRFGYFSSDGSEFIYSELMISVANNDEDIDSLPKVTSKIYPNPFNPETTISFNIPQPGKVNLSIYNIKGQLVKTLLDEETSAGTHSLVWNGKNERGKSVASGIYFSKIKTEADIQTKKMLLIK